MSKRLQSIFSSSLSGNKAQVLCCNHNFASGIKSFGGVPQSVGRDINKDIWATDNINICFLNMQEKIKRTTSIRIKEVKICDQLLRIGNARWLSPKTTVTHLVNSDIISRSYKSF